MAGEVGGLGEEFVRVRGVWEGPERRRGVRSEVAIGIWSHIPSVAGSEGGRV